MPIDQRKMVDISLLVDLSSSKEAICARMRGLCAPEFLFDSKRVYQECDRNGVGLHVTLFEFLHHAGHRYPHERIVSVFHTIHSKISRLFQSMHGKIQIRLAEPVLAPDNLYLRCSFMFPNTRVDSTKQIVENCKKIKGGSSDLFNLNTAPAQPHCTVWRFPGDMAFSKGEFDETLHFIASSANEVVHECATGSIVLTLAELEPFDKITMLPVTLGLGAKRKK